MSRPRNVERQLNDGSELRRITAVHCFTMEVRNDKKIHKVSSCKALRGRVRPPSTGL